MKNVVHVIFHFVIETVSFMKCLNTVWGCVLSCEIVNRTPPINEVIVVPYANVRWRKSLKNNTDNHDAESPGR